MSSKKVHVTLSIDAEALQVLMDYAGDRGRGEFVSKLVMDFHRRKARAKAVKAKRQAQRIQEQMDRAE